MRGCFAAASGAVVSNIDGDKSAGRGRGRGSTGFCSTGEARRSGAWVSVGEYNDSLDVGSCLTVTATATGVGEGQVEVGEGRDFIAYNPSDFIVSTNSPLEQQPAKHNSPPHLNSMTTPTPNYSSAPNSTHHPSPPSTRAPTPPTRPRSAVRVRGAGR